MVNDVATSTGRSSRTARNALRVVSSPSTIVVSPMLMPTLFCIARRTVVVDDHGQASLADLTGTGVRDPRLKSVE